MPTNGYRGSFGGNENVLELDTGNGWFHSFVNITKKRLNCTFKESYGI